MPGLLDIAKSTIIIPVNGTDIPVYGVSAKGIAYLIQRFPEIRAMFANKAAALTTTNLFELVPDAIASIIAAGCGSPGDKKTEEVAARLAAEAQIELLEAIIALTMPKGLGPFVAKLEKLMSGLNVESMNTPDMQSLAGLKGS